ncbi:MAG TPA: peptidoglycan DD-metalloendopeptidase family protein [Nevskia sp.]|jgi:septal ring factor EnvC (AmiA/AmiB activator)|nr:peptidoglycan DD-metalloendopeptidase family protein [Nevskia sp.]
MIPKSRKVLLCLAGMLLAGLAVGDERYQQSAEELAKVRSRIEAVSKSIEHDKVEQDQLRGAVEAAERKVDEATGEARRIAAQVELQEARARQAQAEQAAAERRLAEQKDALARQLRAGYVMGRGGKAELLLSQEDPDRVDRMLVYYDSLNRARAAAIDAINAQIKQVAALARQYQAQLDALHKLQSSHRQALAALEQTRSERAEAMTKVSQRIAGEAQELKGLQASEKQLKDLLEQLRQALADVPVEPEGGHKSFPEMRGHMDWPLRGDLLARYGDAKAGGRLVWKGWWISAPEGAPVRASARGRIAYVGWLTSYGLIVVLQHEKGFFTLYGHNSAVTRSAGEWVGPGDVIAKAGNTGGYEQTGLYFEVRKGTEPMDPKDWLGK